MRLAVPETIKLISKVHNLSRTDAYALARMAVAFEVAHSDSGEGTHAMTPKVLFGMADPRRHRHGPSSR